MNHEKHEMSRNYNLKFSLNKTRNFNRQEVSCISHSVLTLLYIKNRKYEAVNEKII